jgi:ATP-dependent Clp protease adapter protein ClpS
VIVRPLCTGTTAAPGTVEMTRELVEEIESIFDDGWSVIVHNDDVTTFETVITALRRIFGHSADDAEALAWRVHREGKAIVAVQTKDEATASVKKLHSYKIQASIEKV